jgi:hypothetical protein
MRTWTTLLMAVAPASALGGAFGVRHLDAPAVYSPRRTRSALAVTPRSIELRRLEHKSESAQWLNAMRLGPSEDGHYALSTNSTRLNFLQGKQYSGRLGFGDEEFEVIIDTGSSDTWVVHQNFTCVLPSGIPILVCLRQRRFRRLEAGR